MQIAELIDRNLRQRRELDSELELLKKLPEGLELRSVFHYAGYWRVNLESSLASSLALLPPCNATMTLRDGSWIADPENQPLNWEQRVLALVQSRSGVTWFHYLADGTGVEVNVEGARLPALDGYVTHSAHHHAVLVRKPRALAMPAISAEDQDQADWDAFYATEGYSERQKMFARVFHIVAKRNLEITVEMLPVPAATTMEVAGETLEIRHGSGQLPAEKVPEGSTLHGLTRMGRFWGFFTREQAERLVAFASSQRKDMQQAQADSVRPGLQLALAAIASFQEKFLSAPVANAPDAEVLTRWVQMQTGYPVTVSVRDSLTGRRNGVYELWLHLWKWNEGAKLTVPNDVYDPAGFDFQNPSFYAYEDNAGQF
jgi:hypothetical protein